MVVPRLVRTVVVVLIYVVRDIDDAAASGVNVIGVDNTLLAYSGYTFMPNSILGG